MEAARRLGYPGPDPVARSLRTRKAGAIGLLLTEQLSYAFRDPAAVAFLEGLTLECDQAGIGLLLVPASPDSEDVRAVSSALPSTGSSPTRCPTTTRTWPRCWPGRCRR